MKLYKCLGNLIKLFSIDIESITKTNKRDKKTKIKRERKKERERQAIMMNDDQS
jgi:soluble P-type ATPase